MSIDFNAYYDVTALANPIINVAAVNVRNRIDVAAGQVAAQRTAVRAGGSINQGSGATLQSHAVMADAIPKPPTSVSGGKEVNALIDGRLAGIVSYRSAACYAAADGVRHRHRADPVPPALAIGPE